MHSMSMPQQYDYPGLLLVLPSPRSSYCFTGLTPPTVTSKFQTGDDKCVGFEEHLRFSNVGSSHVDVHC
jgi:hypothetical protein